MKRFIAKVVAYTVVAVVLAVALVNLEKYERLVNHLGWFGYAYVGLGMVLIILTKIGDLRRRHKKVAA
jgi:hypothetical protein